MHKILHYQFLTAFIKLQQVKAAIFNILGYLQLIPLICIFISLLLHVQSMHPNQRAVFDIFSLKIVTKVHVVISACETV